jgi:hypothetical protein
MCRASTTKKIVSTRGRTRLMTLNRCQRYALSGERGDLPEGDQSATVRMLRVIAASMSHSHEAMNGRM